MSYIIRKVDTDVWANGHGNIPFHILGVVFRYVKENIPKKHLESDPRAFRAVFFTVQLSPIIGYDNSDF